MISHGTTNELRAGRISDCDLQAAARKAANTDRELASEPIPVEWLQLIAAIERQRKAR